MQISYGDIFEGAPSADAIVSPANSFGFMDGGIDMVGELVLFILTDCETRYTNVLQQGKLLSRAVYIALYYRPAASAKSYSYIGLCLYFVPPDGLLWACNVNREL